MNKNKNKNKNISLLDKILRRINLSRNVIIIIIVAIVFIVSGFTNSKIDFNDVKEELLTGIAQEAVQSNQSTIDGDKISNLPEYNGEPFVYLDTKPEFNEEELYSESFEFYSELDEMGRCQYAKAVIGKDIMPKGERGAIGSVKPTGWHTVKYDCVDGKYLYNRCHLIGWQLTGENANEKNLITGTRYMNVEGMLPFENMVADYVKETGNHVAYSVTPIFYSAEQVARGVQIDAYSIEDIGEGISFSVYCFNVQPGVEIDYQTGESKLVEVS